MDMGTRCLRECERGWQAGSKSEEPESLQHILMDSGASFWVSGERGKQAVSDKEKRESLQHSAVDTGTRFLSERRKREAGSICIRNARIFREENHGGTLSTYTSLKRAKRVEVSTMKAGL